MFLWGRWRHDMVAMGALLATVFAGLVPAETAFSGFGHPAVITVACVLVLSHGLQSTGAVDALTQRALPSDTGPTLSIAALTGVGAVLSAFMNNVGAMALLMPVAVQVAGKHDLPPGKVLMPLAFGTILGGMTTLIGTPPNLIVSGFRSETGLGSFGMFDFTPVGLAVAVVAIVFVALVGWRMVPAREQKGAGSFDTGTYLTEARVSEDSKVAGKHLYEVEQGLEEIDAQIVGMARGDFRVSAPNAARIVRPGDILVIEAEPESLASALSNLGLKLEEDVPPDEDEDEDGDQEQGAGADGDEEDEDKDKKDSNKDQEILLQELVAMPGSSLIGRSANDIQIRTRYSLNLLAISRQGRRTIKRLRSTAIQAGDVLLMQGAEEPLAGFTAEFGCVPLAKRAIRIPDKQRVVVASSVMAMAIGGAAFGLLPAAVAFAAGMLLYMAFRVVPLRKAYDAIDWPVIVLLGAMIPVATAMASTGTADLIAQLLLDSVAQGNAIIALALILIVTMSLSDFMNNAATAAVMCPIAISTADQLSASPDSFLMAVERSRLMVRRPWREIASRLRL